MRLQVSIERLPTRHLNQARKHLVVWVEIMKSDSRRINGSRRAKAGNPIGERVLLARKTINKASVGKSAGLIEQLAHGDILADCGASECEIGQIM